MGKRNRGDLTFPRSWLWPVVLSEPASVAGYYILDFSRSDRYAVRDSDASFPGSDELRIMLAPIIEACAVLNDADSFWAQEWCNKRNFELDHYWGFQNDGEQRPALAMDELAQTLIRLFEGVAEEDVEPLSAELRRLLDAAAFLTNFKGRWVDD